MLAAVVTAFEEVCIDVIGVVMCGAPWREDEIGVRAAQVSARRSPSPEV
jgi:hypothetical protein